MHSHCLKNIHKIYFGNSFVLFKFTRNPCSRVIPGRVYSGQKTKILLLLLSLSLFECER